jgi:hypothetical protein
MQSKGGLLEATAAMNRAVYLSPVRLLVLWLLDLSRVGSTPRI